MTCQSCVDAVRTSLQGVAGKSQNNLRTVRRPLGGAGKPLKPTTLFPFTHVEEHRGRRKERLPSRTETRSQSLEYRSQACQARALYRLWCVLYLRCLGSEELDWAYMGPPPEGVSWIASSCCLRNGIILTKPTAALAMFHPRQLPILMSQLTGLEATLHGQKHLRRQSHQPGPGNRLPLILLNVHPVIQQVWTGPWGLFREKSSQMFQTQSLPPGNDEHASVAHGRDEVRWILSWDSGGTWPVQGSDKGM